jgi:non-ribosomal peptide synthetase component F
VDFSDGLRSPVGPTAYHKIGAQAAAIQVHAIATERRCSEHAVLLAAFGLVLASRCGRSSFVLSCPVSLRRSAELFGVFGPLTDMMWFRIDVTGSTVRECVRPVFKDILTALSHPCPISAVASQVVGGSPASLAALPNMQCEYFPPERIANPRWVTSSVKVKEVMPVYLLTGQLQSPFWLDLTVAGEPIQPDTDYSLVYRTDLFHPSTVQRMAADVEACIFGRPMELR